MKQRKIYIYLMEITNKYNYCINKGKRLIEIIKEISKI